MQSYDSKSIVSKTEAQALKELIFNRARQRAEALSNDTQNKYTDSFRNELMDIARKSFNTPENPFARKIEETKKTEVVKSQPQQQIGFKQKTSEENIKEIIKLKNEIARESIIHKEIAEVMDNNGSDFAKRKNFTGALDFLNAQAGIYMAGKNKTSFEAIA